MVSEKQGGSNNQINKIIKINVPSRVMQEHDFN